MEPAQFSFRLSLDFVHSFYPEVLLNADELDSNRDIGDPSATRLTTLKPVDTRKRFMQVKPHHFLLISPSTG